MKKIFFGLSFLILITSIYAISPERQIFNEAENRYNNGDLDFALNRYQELMEEYPLSEYAPDAYFRIAVITFRSGNIEEASILFDRIEKRYLNTRFIDYLPFWKGLISFNQANWDDAAVLFSIFLDKNPGSLLKEAHLYGAKAEYNAGRNKSAISILNSWIDTENNIYKDPYILTFYLTLLEKNGDYHQVIDIYKDIDPDLFQKTWLDRFYLIYAESLYKTGEIIESKQYYEKILDAEPDISSIGFIRLFSMNKNNIERQREIFDKAQLRLSGHPVMLNKFLLRVGIDSYNNGHFELAASYLWRIWRTSNIDEIDSLVPVYLAKILVSEGDRYGAIDILSNYSSKVAHEDELLLYTLSNVLIEDKRWLEAEESLNNFLLIYPDSEYYSSAAWMYAYSLYKSEQFSASRALIDSVLAEGKGGSYTTDFILLSARVYIKLGNLPYALAMFKEYLPFDDGNPEIWFDIIKLQFNQGQYKSVSDTYLKLVDKSILDQEGAYVSLIQYIAGLGDIAQGQYREGLDKLSLISEDVLNVMGLESIYPYIDYYRGWATYKLANYKEAFDWFEHVALNYPDSNVYSDSLYFAGWSVYLLEDYALAAKYFADFSHVALLDGKTRGLFFYSKSMYALDKLDEAELVFQNIYTRYPEDSYADDALFEHARILKEIGEFDHAISTYQELYKRYKTSALAEESLFRVGEIYMQLRDFKKAQESYYYHRLKFPNAKLGDVSLYWGAEAAEELGEIYGAILLLDKLLTDYPESSFRPGSLQKIAYLYAKEGEYRNALIYYGDFLTGFPESDSVNEVQMQIKKLNLLQSGSDESEAGFLVLIDEIGIRTIESRNAHIQLAKIYLYKYNGREEQAFDLLTKVADYRDQFPYSAAKALYYLGDYYLIKKEYVNAAKSFVEAAKLYPEDKDLTAISLLRAAEMSILAGDIKTAEKMVNLLEINFPSSEWLEEGNKLLEKNR
jgi:TolA-binding protein